MPIRYAVLAGAVIGLWWAGANAQHGQARDLAPLAPPRGELVMFERAGCIWCAQWNREIGPIYPKTDEAKRYPLRRHDHDKSYPGAPELAKPIHFIPTFVLAVCGREVGRVVGYPGEEHFWGLLEVEIKRLERAELRTC